MGQIPLPFAMRWDTAKLHFGVGSALKPIRKSLDRLKPSWLCSDARKHGCCSHRRLKNLCRRERPLVGRHDGSVTGLRSRSGSFVIQRFGSA
jgi:hypothetical protein